MFVLLMCCRCVVEVVVEVVFVLILCSGCVMIVFVLR